MLRNALLATVALCTAASATAGWRRAESRHFIVYNDGDDATVRDAADRLEKLAVLQRALAGVTDKPSTIKVNVYLLSSNARVQATMPWPATMVAGYYDATVRGPIAVNTRSDDTFDRFPAQLVLFHELTHHFMFQYFPVAYPLWYSEGFADFVGASTIGAHDMVGLGEPVMNRYYSLRGHRREEWIATAKLLGARSFADVDGRTDLLYAEGWLLTHYLLLGHGREGQLARYLNAINAGQSYDAAAKAAFGDLGRLDRELKVYSELNKLPAKDIAFKPIDAGSITVSAVPPAQAALMVADIRLYAGVPADTAAAFAAAVRKLATGFPDDPFALRLRAEADRLAGDSVDRAAAIARWATVAPADPLMLLHQGLLAVDLLSTAKSTDGEKWTAARATILAAHKAAPRDPQILKAYHDSFVAQGLEPPVGAQNALFLALDLVPQDAEVRYQLARDFERRGLYGDAAATIRPAAYVDEDAKTPADQARREKLRERFRLAGRPVHETARQMLARLEARTATTAGPSTN